MCTQVQGRDLYCYQMWWCCIAVQELLTDNLISTHSHILTPYLDSPTYSIKLTVHSLLSTVHVT